MQGSPRNDLIWLIFLLVLTVAGTFSWWMYNHNVNTTLRRRNATVTYHTFYKHWRERNGRQEGKPWYIGTIGVKYLNRNDQTCYGSLEVQKSRSDWLSDAESYLDSHYPEGSLTPLYVDITARGGSSGNHVYFAPIEEVRLMFSWIYFTFVLVALIAVMMNHSSAELDSPLGKTYTNCGYLSFVLFFVLIMIMSPFC